LRVSNLLLLTSWLGNNTCALAFRKRQREEARSISAPVYVCFTEGFETTDFRGARALLASLTQGPHPTPLSKQRASNAANWLCICRATHFCSLRLSSPFRKMGRRRVLRPKSTGRNCPMSGISRLICVRLACLCCVATPSQFLRQFALRQGHLPK
jgi:hypothetical protein